MIDELKDLTKDWRGPVDWRIQENEPQFGLSVAGGGICWFPYYRAPERIEKIITAWLKTLPL